MAPAAVLPLGVAPQHQVLRCSQGGLGARPSHDCCLPCSRGHPRGLSGRCDGSLQPLLLPLGCWVGSEAGSPYRPLLLLWLPLLLLVLALTQPLCLLLAVNQSPDHCLRGAAHRAAALLPAAQLLLLLLFLLLLLSPPSQAPPPPAPWRSSWLPRCRPAQGLLTACGESEGSHKVGAAEGPRLPGSGMGGWPGGWSLMRCAPL
ncbi:hypothetical protein V8C86DRAFT_2885432, partial [Haematococcus lacustris]